MSAALREDNDAFTLAGEAQLPAGDGLDGRRVASEPLGFDTQCGVLHPQGGHILRESSRRFTRAHDFQQPSFANQGVGDDRAGGESKRVVPECLGGRCHCHRQYQTAAKSTRPFFPPHANVEVMHPWHDSYVDDALIDTAFPVVIEVPKGSKNKYELDKETGLLRLDRVLYSSVHYPADYGFIPRTFCDDGDPLDALVLGQEPVHPLTIVEARAIGVMRMRDEKGIDDKIVAVSVRDPAFADYTDKDQLPAHMLRQIRRFFEEYKVLEHKQVIVEDLLGVADAVRIIREALDMYRQLRRGEIARY